MHSKFRLLHKGIVLLVVPMAFTAGLMFYIYGLMQDMDREVQQHLSAAKVLSAAESFEVGCMVAHVGMIAYMAFHNDESQRHHTQGTAEMAMALKHLDQWLEQTPRHASDLKTQRERVKFDWKQENEVMSLPSTMSMRFMTEKAPTDLKEDADNFVGGALIRDIMQEDRLKDERAIETRAHIWSLTRLSLLIGVIGSFMITLSLGAYFNRNIVDRLKNVRRNIWLINDRGTLSKPMPGGDEIAELDQAIHETARQLKELESYKTRMIEFIAGQLAAPLDSIAAAMSKVKAYPSLNEQGQRSVSDASLSLDRLKRLVSELTGLDKLTEGKIEINPSPVALSELVDAAKAAVQGAADDKRIEIKTFIDDWTLEADADRILQVLVNLLSNAVKFSPEGSQIELTAIGGGDAGQISVTDHGRGIPAEMQDKLFSRYMQVKRDDAADHKGFGLGLAISKEIVEQHGGTIWLKSEVGKGSTFTVTLPKSAEAKPVADLKPIDRGAEPSRGFKWFLADARMWQKGLAIVAIPLVVQIVSIGWIGSLLQSNNSRVESAIRVQAVTQATVSFSRSLIEVVYFAWYYRMFRRQSEKIASDEASGAVREKSLALQHLDAGVGAVANEAAEQALSSAGRLVALAGQNVTVEQLVPRREETAALEKSTVALANFIHDGLTREVLLEAAQPEESKRAFHQILMVMIAAVAINGLLAGLFLLLAWKAVSKRIQHVVANAQNLLAQRPLTLPERGADEIGQIDRAFFAGGEALLRLREFKQQMVSIVGHDLRTPLTSVMGLFELLSAGVCGSLPDDLVKVCDDAQQETERLINLINEILDVEKAKVLKPDLVETSTPIPLP